MASQNNPDPESLIKELGPEGPELSTNTKGHQRPKK